MAKITLEEMAEISKDLNWVNGLKIRVEAIGEGTARLLLPASPETLRPGGTISGPSMMTLADYALYAAVLGAIGRVELAVTTSLTINFLRKPPPGDLVADARLLKVGKRLAYGEVVIYSEAVGEEDPVAHVTSTYSIPPNR